MQSPEPGDDAELTLRELRRLVHGIKTASYSVERSCKVTGAQLFVLRELAHPTAALDVIYAGVFEPTHKRLCQIWAEATGEGADSDRTKLIVFTMIGQVIYFRIGREAVLRRMGWKDIGPKEAAAIVAVAKDNLAAVLAARKGQTP